MRALGFEESMGMHDFIFRWNEQTSIDEVLALTSRMHEKLKGLDVNYELTTIS